MSDILIKASQRLVSADKNVWQKYDIVHVVDDFNRGYGYGLLEVWPDFVIVRIEKTTPLSIAYLIGDADTKSPYAFDFDAELSAADLDKVKSGGEWFFPIITKDQVKIKTATILPAVK